MIKRILIAAAVLSVTACRQAPHTARTGAAQPIQAEKAIDSCKKSVSSWLERTAYRHIDFQDAVADGTVNNHHQVAGTVTAQRGVNSQFSFNCSVDFNTGHVTSMDVKRQ